MSINIRPGVSIGPGNNFKVPYIPLVTSGMLYNFDAASYSGSGDWIDGCAGTHATLVNAPSWSSDNGGIFTLNQSYDQYFTAPWPSFEPTFTIDMWFNFTADQAGDAPCLITDSFSGGDINFTINATQSKLQTGWYNTNWNGQFADNNVGAPFTHDGTTWYNIIMAVGATEYKDYINGDVSYAPGNFGGGSAPIGSGSSQMLYIGHRWDNDQTINAKIAVVNIYNRALSDQEAAQNYNHYKKRFGL